MALYQTENCICSNCGKSGHVFRQCVEPVSSYGVLVFRWINRTGIWTPPVDFCKSGSNSSGTSNLIPQVLMIQRKDTLGFMDIMRGKYKLNEPDYIRKQIHGMTISERERLLTDDFDKIWNDLWGSDFETTQKYANNKTISKQKLGELRQGVTNTKGESYSLADLLRQEPAIYETPEWGFPKGRRDLYETDSQCAFRELEEETGINENDLLKIVNLSPFIEQFYGSNNINYRHTYFIAQYVGQTPVSFNKTNVEMTREIGNLAWKNLDEALIILRPENVEKRGILVQLANILRNFYPVIPYTLHGEKTENKEVEQQEEYVFVCRNTKSATRGERRNRTFNTHNDTRSSTNYFGGGATRERVGTNYTSRSRKCNCTNSCTATGCNSSISSTESISNAYVIPANRHGSNKEAIQIKEDCNCQVTYEFIDE